MTVFYNSIEYQGYPVHSSSTGIEGAMVRYSEFPQPEQVFKRAMLGLPKVFPISEEPVTVELAEDFLKSAITQIEMELGLNLSEVVHYEHVEYMPDMFQANWSGINLPRWPATEIISVQIKYQHAQAIQPTAAFTFPSTWCFLKRNKLNIIPGQGNVAITNNAGAGFSGYGNGVFAASNALTHNRWQPGVIEVVYKAGFNHDKLPSSVADLIMAWATWMMLVELGPILFPNGSVTDTVDAISQSVSLVIPQTIRAKIDDLEKKKNALAASVKKQFGRTIGMATFGA